jgi:hypothetical protein
MKKHVRRGMGAARTESHENRFRKERMQRKVQLVPLRQLQLWDHSPAQRTRI